MPGDVNITPIAALLADPTRVNILLALGDGRALPAGELARRARVAASTVSMHLSKLVEYRMLTVEKQGRHRYFRITDLSIMQAIEVLAPFALDTPAHSLRESEVGGAIRQARMCYNHLAGVLGVTISQALVEKQLLVSIDEGYTLTSEGEQWFHELGIDIAKKKKQGVLFVPHHIDWSERRYHVAGNLGAALARRLIELEWITHTTSSRAVHVTEKGRQALSDELQLHLD
ncbi:MAG TPA: winged helix-turn-helix domain-containing protein [Ktedonobacteraceae bacterium]|jgi:DNA-binding transcriptional ArsR family regulator|nr:winged helix-turn-helix domain-containing protein [Ktedonobacteraceae bacterium]